MAESFVTGRSGKVVVGATTLNITQWQFQPEADLHETTHTGASSGGGGYKSHIGGLIGATVSIQANLDLDAYPWVTPPNLLPGQTVALELFIGATTDKITGNAVVQGLPITSPVNNLVTYTLNATFTGVISWPT